MNLGDVAEQLINPTEYELKQMADEAHPEARPGGQEAIQMAQGWILQVVADDSRPPLQAVYYAYEGDQRDRCDIVRVRYAIAENGIEIAQTFCVISIVIDWPKPDESSLLEHVLRVGRQLLKEPQRLNFEVSAEESGIIIGKQSTQQLPTGHKDFIDHLRWWSDGVRVGFVTLKKGKRPGRAVMSWAKELNLNWFSLCE